MNTPLRNFLGNLLFIHVLVILGLSALLGYIMLGQKLLLLCVALSFSGAICGSFIRILDAIRAKTHD